jgi:hypothetical protein
MYCHIPPHLVPAARRRRAKLDDQAARERRHKASLKERKIPTRDDFAMAALDVILILLNNAPTEDMPQQLYAAVVGELIRADFDRDSSRIRLDRMSERIHRDRDRRNRHREWKAERQAEAQDNASPGGAE